MDLIHINSIYDTHILFFFILSNKHQGITLVSKTNMIIVRVEALRSRSFQRLKLSEAEDFSEAA